MIMDKIYSSLPRFSLINLELSIVALVRDPLQERLVINKLYETPREVLTNFREAQW